MSFVKTCHSFNIFQSLSAYKFQGKLRFESDYFFEIENENLTKRVLILGDRFIHISRFFRILLFDRKKVIYYERSDRYKHFSFIFKMLPNILIQCDSSMKTYHRRDLMKMYLFAMEKRKIALFRY